MARSSATAYLALAILALIQVGAYAQVPKYATFYDAVSKRTDMKLVKAAIDTVGLATYLKDPTRKITVFVPDDAAFRNLAKSFPTLAPLADPARIAKLNPVQKDMLKKVLYYHMFNGVTNTKAFKKGVVFHTFFSNTPIKVLLQGQNVAAKGGFLPTVQAIGNKAAVKLANVKCGAGLAHVVGAPLLPFPASTIKNLAG